MANKQKKRKWPCKSYTAKQLKEYNNNGLALYFSDPDVVDFGEIMFRSTAQKIPLWITPNTLTRCGLIFNTILFLISFAITPALDNEMGEEAAKWVPSLICIIMAVIQILVSALDNWDGLHARGTNQCSDLGALLDHYFDSISIAMNSVSAVTMFNANWFVCIFGTAVGPMIFNMQLMINHYLKQEPRVMGPEVQFGTCAIDIICAFLFYYKMTMVIQYISYATAGVAVFLLIKYVIQFLPKFIGNPTILGQLSMFWASYGVVSILYLFGWISTFEMCICGVWISWDFNGQIVTHDILKEKLPTFKPYYFLYCGVILEYYYFNPLVWMVDSKNNIHLTTLIMWGVFAYKNVTHHVMMQNKLLLKIKRKNKNKNKGSLSG